jgi:hypothetical protein
MALHLLLMVHQLLVLAVEEVEQEIFHLFQEVLVLVVLVEGVLEQKVVMDPLELLIQEGEVVVLEERQV